MIRCNRSAEIVMRKNLTEGQLCKGPYGTFYILSRTSRSNSANEGWVISIDNHKSNTFCSHRFPTQGLLPCNKNQKPESAVRPCTKFPPVRFCSVNMSADRFHLITNDIALYSLKCKSISHTRRNSRSYLVSTFFLRIW